MAGDVDDLAEPVEVAYLAGGRNHAALVAHLALYEQGLVEVPDEVLERTDPTRAELVEVAAARPARPRVGTADADVTAHPLEQRVLAAYARGDEPQAIVHAAAMSPEMTAVHDGLAA